MAIFSLERYRYSLKRRIHGQIFSAENAMVVKLLHCDILYKMEKLNMFSRNATIVFNNTDDVYFQLVIFTKV
jgi:hypothetical protein